MDLQASRSQDSFRVVGNSNTGKTNIIQTFTKGITTNINHPTVGIEYYSKVINTETGRVKIKIFDTAGQQAYRSITTPYYRNANSVFIVFDVTDRNSFNDAFYWINEVRERANQNVVIGLLGNKVDLTNRRAVSKQEGESFSKRQNIFYMETTIFTPQTINNAFEKLATETSKRTKITNLEFSRNIVQLNSKNNDQQNGCSC